VIIKSAEVEDKEYYIEEPLIKKNCTLMKNKTIDNYTRLHLICGK
jgi:hypothetical protein